MKKIIFILCLLMMSFSAYAGSYWNQEANADLRLSGGQGFIGYSSEQNNILSSVNYTRCDITGSIFTPIAADFDGDSIPDFVITTIDKFTVYNHNCEIIAVTILPETPTSMPVLINIDGDSNQEIVITNTTHISLWSANMDSDITVFTERSLNTLNYSSVISLGAEGLTCPREFSDLCWMVSYNQKDIIIANFTANTITELQDELNTVGGFATTIRNGIAGARTSITTSTIIPITNEAIVGANTWTTELINADGTNTGISYNFGSSSGAIDEKYYISSYVARVGNLFRVFSMVRYDETIPNNGVTAVYDTDGNFLHCPQQAATGTCNFDTSNHTSNWMIGDYDKDGQSEGCYIMNSTNDAGNQILRCYDSNFDTPKITVNFSYLMNLSSSAVLGDFDPSFNTLGIATKEGIFYETATGFPHKKFSTGKTISNSDMYNGTGIIVNQPSSGSPIYVYTDRLEGFIFRDSSVADSCGNGVCDTFESAFSCPIDCGTISSAECITSADCPTNYPVCIGNICMAFFENPANFTYTCLTGADCPITEPLCIDGICAAGVSGGASNVDEDEHTISIGVERDDALDEIGGFIEILFHGNSLAKFIVAIFLIVSFMGMGAEMGRNPDPTIVMGMGILGLIFSTVLGLVGIYLLIMIIMSFVAILSIKHFLFRSSAA